ncbi:MAG: stage IV sporulation protein A [Ruminococcaceae bacterium]|nr:stage IV sporulation protein A [Oscillospiraceae bacterium]
MANTSIYQDIAARTGGNIYLGVVGPVRTGKSTFVKRFMEQMVLPCIDDPYRAERARDELPQSGSGKTIMTTEPKFVPEEAVTIRPDHTAQLQVRLIDSVGYMVDGAVGATEDGEPRLITTPWFEHEIPMTEAAELGTKKVMQEHCTIGIVITTDGTVTDIPRQDYVDSEARAIRDMQATGKPFVVIVNSKEPEGAKAKTVCDRIRDQFGAGCLCMDCQTMQKAQINALLQGILMEFPLRELQFWLPGWVRALDAAHPLKKTLFEAMRSAALGAVRLSQGREAAESLRDLEQVAGCTVREIDLGSGTVSAQLQFPESLFYEVLAEASGFDIKGDGDLIELLQQMAEIKKEYEQIAPALQEVQATGYGIVMPRPEQMKLERPEPCRKGGSYGIRLKASAPSIHLLRTDILTEISPMVGDAQQSESLVRHMQEDYETDTEKLWQSNIFGKSVYELISDGFGTKLRHLPEDARMKFKNALSRIVNEGAGGLICIIL